MNKSVRFSSIKTGSPFTPAPGQAGAGSVYIKTVNWICPKLGTEDVGIFRKEDDVCEVFLPKNILDKLLKKVK